MNSYMSAFLEKPLMIHDSLAEELRQLFIGQSLELSWTHKVSTPSVEEYLQMVDGSKLPPNLIPSPSGNITD